MTYSFIPGDTVEQIVLVIFLERLLFSPESEALCSWRTSCPGAVGEYR